MIEQEKTYRIIISGGGTGGHIYPAISIAQALKDILQHVDILFVGAKGKMEMKKVPEAGFNITGLWISGMPRKAFPNLMFPLKLCTSLLGATRLIKAFNPHAVVGTGGYASGPPLYIAGRKGIPTLIQEQNAYPGLTNKWLSNTAKTICVAHEGMDIYFPKEKIVVTGNPVRKTILLSPDRIHEAWKHFELNPERKTLLVIGGSLGSRTINESVMANLDKINKAGFQLIWQVGDFYYDEIQKRTGKLSKHIVIKEFIRQMNFAYAIADVVISRAGALSIAELMLTGKPSILVPSPNVTENHQNMNAQDLASKGACQIVKDEDAINQLIEKAMALLNNEQKRKEFSFKIRSMAHENAAMNIANEIVKLIG